MRLDPKLATPVPSDDDLEREVAAGLRSREYDEELDHYWARRAVELEDRAPTPDELDRLEQRWCDFMRELAIDLVAVAEVETRRIAATLKTFPDAERAMAWTEERAALSNPRLRDRFEREYREQLLGVPYDADLSWLTRLGKIEFRGEALKTAVLERRWQRFLRTSQKHLRNERIEAAIAAEPQRDDLRRVHSDWLQQQPQGAGLARYISLMFAGPARAWRAALMLELDDEVAGAFAFQRTPLEWRRGLIVAASVMSMGELILVLEHPAALVIDELTILADRSWNFDDLRGRGPFRVKQIALNQSREYGRGPLDRLQAACPGAAIAVHGF